MLPQRHVAGENYQFDGAFFSLTLQKFSIPRQFRKTTKPLIFPSDMSLGIVNGESGNYCSLKSVDKSTIVNVSPATCRWGLSLGIKNYQKGDLVTQNAKHRSYKK